MGENSVCSWVKYPEQHFILRLPAGLFSVLFIAHFRIKASKPNWSIAKSIIGQICLFKEYSIKQQTKLSWRIPTIYIYPPPRSNDLPNHIAWFPFRRRRNPHCQTEILTFDDKNNKPCLFWANFNIKAGWMKVVHLMVA